MPPPIWNFVLLQDGSSYLTDWFERTSLRVLQRAVRKVEMLDVPIGVDDKFQRVIFQSFQPCGSLQDSSQLDVPLTICGFAYVG